MGDFFKGWRRMAGIVMLFPAFLAMTEWIEALARRRQNPIIEDSGSFEVAIATISLTVLSSILLFWPSRKAK